MYIYKGSLTTLVAEGRITLQICGNGIRKLPNRARKRRYPGPKREELEHHPDEWFFFLRMRSGEYPAVGNEGGYLYFTRKGWEANKDNLKAAFEASPRKRGTWEDFEKHVAEFFEKMRKQTEHLIDKKDKEIQELGELRRHF